MISGLSGLGNPSAGGRWTAGADSAHGPDPLPQPLKRGLSRDHFHKVRPLLAIRYERTKANRGCKLPLSASLNESMYDSRTGPWSARSAAPQEKASLPWSSSNRSAANRA